MTYNNPVFLEQCKLRKIEVDETGFVEQIPLDKKEKLLVKEVKDDDDDFDDDDFDDDDDELFSKKPSTKKTPLKSPSGFIEKKSGKQGLIDKKTPTSFLNASNDNDDDFDDDLDEGPNIFKKTPPGMSKEPDRPSFIVDKEDDDLDDLDDNISLKIGGNKTIASPKSEAARPTPMAPPPMTPEDEIELFGHEVSKPSEPKLSVRDRMNSELGEVKPPKIKLNIDKTNQSSQDKPKLKLNIKPK